MEQIKNLQAHAFPEFIGKDMSVLLDHLEKHHKDQLPTVEMRDYLYNFPKEIPEWMKDGNWYYFFGSILRDRGGDASVPYVRWDGSKRRRRASWVGNEWDGDDRVLLLLLDTVPSADSLE
jgi:hypothetical protein